MSRLRSNKVVNQAGTGAPELTYGAVVPGTGTISGAGKVSIGGSITAASFHGDGSALSGIDASTLKDGSNIKVQAVSTGANVTGNVAATGNVTAVDGTFSGNLTVQGTTTTIDTAVTSVDSLSLDGDINLVDGSKINVGTGTDLQIEHTGGNSFIRTSATANGDLAIEARNTGDLYLSAADDVFIRPQGSENGIKVIGNGAVELYHDNNKRLETSATGVTVTGTVSDSKGDLRKIIFKQESSAYTLVAADAGKAIEIASGGITVPNGVFGSGDAITIINDSGLSQSITKGTGLGSLFNVATGTSGNLTFAGRGMATIYFVNSTTCYISGGGLS